MERAYFQFNRMTDYTIGFISDLPDGSGIVYNLYMVVYFHFICFYFHILGEGVVYDFLFFSYGLFDPITPAVEECS